MKRIKKSTWISVLCVFSAIAASQIYGTVQTEKAENETVKIIPTQNAEEAIDMTDSSSEISSPEKEKSEVHTKPIEEKSETLKTETPIIESRTEEVSRPVSAPIKPQPSPSPISFSLPETG